MRTLECRKAGRGVPQLSEPKKGPLHPIVWERDCKAKADPFFCREYPRGIYGDYGAIWTAYGASQAGTRVPGHPHGGVGLHRRRLGGNAGRTGPRTPWRMQGLSGLRRHAHRNGTASGENEARGIRSGTAQRLHSRQDCGRGPSTRPIGTASWRPRTSTGTLRGCFRCRTRRRPRTTLRG